MQKFISQIPQLNNYFSKIPKNKHRDTVKNLIRLGLQATRSYCCKQNSLKSTNVLRNQINIIKENIRELKHVFRHQAINVCKCSQKENVSDNPKILQTQPTISENITIKQQNKKGFKEEQKYQQKPVRDAFQVGTINLTKNQQINPFSKNKGVLTRHHLDDTCAREALTFPVEILAQNQARIKRNSQSFRKHLYQQQINKEELEKIKEQKKGSVDKIKRERTSSNYSKANSKIKSLIEKDRIRYTQRQQEYQFQEGFNKYEYSDENQMEENSSMHQEAAKNYEARLQQPIYLQQNTYEPYFQSSLKGSNQASSHQKSSNNKTSSKKQFQRSKNQFSSKLQASIGELRHQYSKQSAGSQKYFKNNKSAELNNKEKEQQNDVISNSSSFSQFSMQGSRRKQVGKISRRSQND